MFITKLPDCFTHSEGLILGSVSAAGSMTVGNTPEVSTAQGRVPVRLPTPTNWENYLDSVQLII